MNIQNINNCDSVDSNVNSIKKINNYDSTESNCYKKYRKPIGLDFIVENIDNKFKDLDNKKLNILDCGCGCGNYSLELSKLGHNILSIDFNDDMLNILSDQVKSNNINNIKVKKVNLLKELPLENNTFDVIIINQVMHHFGDYNSNFNKHRLLISEFKRILNNDGLLLINTSSLEQHVQGLWWGELIKENLEKYCKRYCPDNLLKDILTENNFNVTVNICKEPFLGDKYFDKNFIFDESIRKTDTLWKYVDDETYNNVINKLKDEKDLDEYFNNRIQLFSEYGQSSFYICELD
jgi:2-polyprenyl-3-methyl-5-hydroxy-6-metoxy-1,4-benzoquinol methylase